MSEKIFIVDGNNLFYRAYFGMSPLEYNGQPTHAIYGFLKMILTIIKKHRPKHLVVCFDQYDKEKRSHRYDISPDYKSNRSEMPEDLRSQIPKLKEACKLFAFNVCQSPGIEADDIIYTLCELAQTEYELSPVVITSDKDMLALVKEHSAMFGTSCAVFDPMKDSLYDTLQSVFNKFQVYPDQFQDYLALVGDKSDNIPGVKGIGPKTATALLFKYDTLDGIYKELDKNGSLIDFTKSINSKIIAGKDDAYMSKSLAVFKDVSNILEIDDLIAFSLTKYTDDDQAAERFMRSLGFSYVGQDLLNLTYEISLEL